MGKKKSRYGGQVYSREEWERAGQKEAEADTMTNGV